MNQGFINRAKAKIEELKKELRDKRAGQEDSLISEEEADRLIDEIGMLLELIEQFES